MNGFDGRQVDLEAEKVRGKLGNKALERRRAMERKNESEVEEQKKKKG
jgi:hypothetical protein